MTNLISREAAIALLDEMYCLGIHAGEDRFDAGIKKAIEALTNMPSVGNEVTIKPIEPQFDGRTAAALAEELERTGSVSMPMEAITIDEFRRRYP